MLNMPRSLATVSSSRQHLGHEREVDGDVDAESEPADGHADEKAVDGGGGGEHEERRCRRDHEDAHGTAEQTDHHPRPAHSPP
jgi:hypothetical protein